jgi:tetratricopeptide (TPR) repeat protein
MGESHPQVSPQEIPMNVRFNPLATGSVLLILLHSGPAAPATAQSSWQWPEKAKNLKVLAPDFPPDRLRSVMTGFTRSLGVRCSYCHMGEEGKPLTTYDFASDSNPKKDVARGMLRMLGTINDQLKEIQPEKVDRVNMWCHTCHRGRPLPMTLPEELGRVYARLGSDSTVAYYRDLHERFYGAGAYDFREPALNEVGYKALANHDPRGAIAIFQLNALQFPESPNVYDSLGEAYLAAKDTAEAIVQYEKVLRLDPKNENAAKALEALKAVHPGNSAR